MSFKKPINGKINHIDPGTWRTRGGSLVKVDHQTNKSDRPANGEFLSGPRKGEKETWTHSGAFVPEALHENDLVEPVR